MQVWTSRHDRGLDEQRGEALGVGITSPEVRAHAILILESLVSACVRRYISNIAFNSADVLQSSAEHGSSTQGWLILLHLIVSRTPQQPDNIL